MGKKYVREKCWLPRREFSCAFAFKMFLGAKYEKCTNRNTAVVGEKFVRCANVERKLDEKVDYGEKVHPTSESGVWRTSASSAVRDDVE